MALRKKPSISELVGEIEKALVECGHAIEDIDIAPGAFEGGSKAHGKLDEIATLTKTIRDRIDEINEVL